jgi:hypothetical protein
MELRALQKKQVEGVLSAAPTDQVAATGQGFQDIDTGKAGGWVGGGDGSGGPQKAKKRHIHFE